MSFFGGATGNYTTSGGYTVSPGAAAESVSFSYTPRRAVRMIGCTCGGMSACRGTCRTPMPE